MTELKTTALAGWYGSNRMLAANVGAELSGCEYVAVPFTGGMSELAHIHARTVQVNDLHRHVINLASVAAHPVLGPKLYRRLRRLAFHPDVLAEAQRICKVREVGHEGLMVIFDGQSWSAQVPPDLEWAVDYFVASWMGRGGNAGTDGEFTGAISTRWNANGGDSATRFRSAASGLPQWRRILRHCNFSHMDAFAFLARVKDAEGHGLYVDAPWPDAGDFYKHKFPPEDQSRLSAVLGAYRKTKVVIRFGVHPLIEKLYPRDKWRWREQTSRAQSNGDVREALIVSREWPLSLA